MLINRERKKIIFEVVIILDGQKERFERIVIKTNLTKKMTILKIKKNS
jgi:predicted transcriptional regulator